MKFSVLLFLLCSIHVSDLPLAGNKEPAIMRGMLDRHNYWRAAVGVEPLEWSDRLAKVAQAWADTQAKRGCGCSHSPDRQYGENIYCSEGLENAAAGVVDDWADEKAYYNPSNGKCKGGVCGHYTQLVWHNTTQVGCGMARCGDKEIWVCNYNPPGNYVKEKAY
jgi:uncharacterized protein YkwD